MWAETRDYRLYRDEQKTFPVLLSKTQAELGRKFTRPRNHLLTELVYKTSQ